MVILQFLPRKKVTKGRFAHETYTAKQDQVHTVKITDEGWRQ